MSEPFIGEIRMFGGNFAIRGWAKCDGQLLSISQYEALFSLLGTIYGGDGRNTFGLPDLRGRVPIHAGSGPGLSTRRIGSRAGTKNETITTSTMPPHNHTPLFKVADGKGDSFGARNNFLATQAVDVDANPNTSVEMYTTAASATFGNNSTLEGIQIADAGGGTAHYNEQPFQVVTYIIALAGLFPSRN